MHCPKCGTENPNGTETCQSCSEPLQCWQDSPAPEESSTTSKLATASLVLGLFSVVLFVLTAIPAVITGIIALIKISKSQGRLKGRGLAITGISIPVILLAIMLPALIKVKALGERLVCGANMTGLSQAMYVYTTEYDNKYPTGSQWCDLLIKHAYVGSKSFKCPGSDEGQSSFALNANALKLGPDAPGDMVLIFETFSGWNQVGGPELLTTENHNGKGCIVMYVNRSIEFVQTENLSRLRWTVEQGD